MTEYKYNEPRYMGEALEYINATYDEHYSDPKSGVQFYEAFVKHGPHQEGYGFLLGSLKKYAYRFGKKEGLNRKDLLKIIHYAVMLLDYIDTEMPPDNPPPT